MVRQQKNIGISILLSALFGPLGLFYSTITGGLIMTLLPIVLVVLSVVGLLGGSTALLLSSFVLLVVFCCTFWLVCIIWGVIAVSDHNEQVLEDQLTQLRVQQIMNKAAIPSGQIHETKPNESVSNEDRPTMQSWLKDNPGKGINDYFTKYGQQNNR